MCYTSHSLAFQFVGRRFVWLFDFESINNSACLLAFHALDMLEEQFTKVMGKAYGAIKGLWAEHTEHSKALIQRFKSQKLLHFKTALIKSHLIIIKAII